MIAGRIGCQPTDLGRLPYPYNDRWGREKEDCSVMAKTLRPPKPKDRISARRFKMKKATATTPSQGGKKSSSDECKGSDWRRPCS